MAHSLAVETQLRPVLVEMGASCPTRGVHLLESDIPKSGVASLDLRHWLLVWAPALRAVMASPQG